MEEYGYAHSPQSLFDIPARERHIGRCAFFHYHIQICSLGINTRCLNLYVSPQLSLPVLHVRSTRAPVLDNLSRHGFVTRQSERKFLPILRFSHARRLVLPAFPVAPDHQIPTIPVPVQLRMTSASACPLPSCPLRLLLLLLLPGTAESSHQPPDL